MISDRQIKKFPVRISYLYTPC